MLFERLLTVVIAIPLVLGSLFAPWPFLFKGIVWGCSLVGLGEFLQISRLTPRERSGGLLLLAVHNALLLSTSLVGEWLLVEISLFVILIFSWALVSGDDPGKRETRLALVSLGFLYLGILAPMIGLIRDFWQGGIWVLLLFAVTWLNDTFAYFVGHWWGRRKLAPQVSPGKTLEGFFGGMVGSLVGSLFVWFFWQPLPLAAALLLALLAGVIGPLGDLSESLLKRAFGVKDSGHLIPGHGGMLDRIDALLFNAPVVYGFALWFSS